MSRGGGAVHRYLDTIHGERRHAIGDLVVYVPAIGLQLERDAPGRQNLKQFPAMRNPQGLATAKGDIGHARSNDGARKGLRLLACQFIVPGVFRTRLFATRETAGIAPIGQLPGHEQRSVVVLRPASRAIQGRIDVK